MYQKQYSLDNKVMIPVLFFLSHRSVIKPTDIVRFDEKISPHELKTLCEKLSDDSDDFYLDDTMDSKGTVFTKIRDGPA